MVFMVKEIGIQGFDEHIESHVMEDPNTRYPYASKDDPAKVA
jgi:hypothetical protein